MIKEALHLLVALLGIISGFILSRLCKDEIKAWRKRLILMSILCFILIIIIMFLNFQYKIPIIASLIFFIINNAVIIFKAK